MHDRQLAEILVERDQDPTFPMRAGENLLVSRVLRPIAGPDDIVSRLLQLLSCATPHAGVEQKPHVPVSRITGSTRS